MSSQVFLTRVKRAMWTTRQTPSEDDVKKCHDSFFIIIYLFIVTWVKNVRILFNSCFTCLFITFCNFSNCSLIHAFHSVDRLWVPSSELNSIQYVAFSFSCSWDTVVIVLCVAPHVVNPQYVSSNSWALIVLGAESDTGEGDTQAPNSNYLWMAPDLKWRQIYCSSAHYPSFTPKYMYNCSGFPPQFVICDICLWDCHSVHTTETISSTSLSRCLSLKKMFHYIEIKLRRKKNTCIITASVKRSHARWRKHP